MKHDLARINHIRISRAGNIYSFISAIKLSKTWCVFKIIKLVNNMIVFTILQQAGVLEGDKNLKMKQDLLAITPICKM